MKEIGGYFSLECADGNMFHSDGILLNSGSNALRYIIKAHKIKKMYVPFYTCSIVWEAISGENIEIVPYEIDLNFLPKISFRDDIYIIYNNYYGICGKNVEFLIKKYKNIIIDNAQAFYYPSKDVASFYSPRKFFGVPDGGIAYSDIKIPLDFDESLSYARCSHLLKRLDKNAESGYLDFQSNEEILKNESIKTMSELTKALLKNIDYVKSKEIRRNNFDYLHKNLSNKNILNIDLSSEDVPMVYPFLSYDASLREKLIQNKIFVAKYWPGIIRDTLFRDNILPLPIDQRYGVAEMQRILEVINE